MFVASQTTQTRTRIYHVVTIKCSGLLNFMNGHALFVGLFAGIMVTDMRFHL